MISALLTENSSVMEVLNLPSENVEEHMLVHTSLCVAVLIALLCRSLISGGRRAILGSVLAVPQAPGTVT